MNYFREISPEITPDVFCFLYGTCRVDVGEPLCHLFPLPIEETKFSKFVNTVGMCQYVLPLSAQIT